MPRKVDNKWVFTDQELDEQIRKAEIAHEEYVKGKPVATSYAFDPETRVLSIRTNDGSRIDFSVSKIRELRDASTNQIRQAYITKTGDAIHWDSLDAHYTISGLAAHIFGTEEWMAELGRRGGKVSSEAKADAARRNGARGGRPSVRFPLSTPNYYIVSYEPTREHAQATAQQSVTQTRPKRKKPISNVSFIESTVATTTNQLCQV